MPGFTQDPLLALARVVIVVAMAFSAFAGAVCLLVAPFLVFGRNQIMTHIASEGIDGLTAQSFLGIGLLLVIVAGLAVLAILFLRHLLRIIDTVGEGDPFIPANALRLAQMAWLTIAIEVASLPAGALGLWIERTTRGGAADFDIDISFGGLLLALILFILARVFRKGAAMREDLEGTV